MKMHVSYRAYENKPFWILSYHKISQIKCIYAVQNSRWIEIEKKK